MVEDTQQRRVAIESLLAARHNFIPRPARQFLIELAADDALLARMRFCLSEERPRLRNSVLIATEETICWAVILGNDPNGRNAAITRARLVLQGLELTPAEILNRLRKLDLWFLAIDAPFATPAAGESTRIEWTAEQLVCMSAHRLRRLAILDQIDAALDAGDLFACARLRDLLAQVGEE